MSSASLPVHSSLVLFFSLFIALSQVFSGIAQDKGMCGHLLQIVEEIIHLTATLLTYTDG
jgi:hypothetical protein